MAGSGAEVDSDEETDWEDVSMRPNATTIAEESVPDYKLGNQVVESSTRKDGKPAAGNIEITLKKAQKSDPKRKKQAEQNAELRALRLTCHKIHTVALLANAIIRNRWLNDDVLQARLLSLTPMSLQTSFSMIIKKRHPDAAKRGRLFESAMMRLTQWWYEEFFEIESNGHIRSRTFDEVQKLLFEVDFEDNDGEVIRSPKSLMKHALKRRGSRDVSSQLFTALCRALDIPARLVVSIQSVPWQAHVGKEKPPGKKSKKGKERADETSDFDPEEGNFDPERADDDDGDMEEVSIPVFRNGDTDDSPNRFPGEGQTLSGSMIPNGKGKEKALPKHIVKLRKSKSSGQRLGSSSSSSQSTPAPPIGGSPPVFWTEVFSRPDGKWMPIDPIRYIVNKRKVFQPSLNDRNNRMVYVIAVEEDGYCRDVTARYARDYGTKTTKAQLGGKGRKEWWESVMALVTRPYRLVRDDVEDEEFEYFKFTEGMPTSVAGFKNHPLYVLEQHLKREEVVFPKAEIGKFRGEAVYPRSNVITLKTAENWMRVGRRVKEGAQALKWVKQRAVTVHRRRAMELAQQEGDEMLQGLYSEAQTEQYIPDPVVNASASVGIVPKNDFGNIDLYTPSMLPKGAAHIPYKGAAKIARKLGFDYAEAVTSFEFKKGRAFPVVSGIVVAAENEETLLEAYWTAERETEAKEQVKRRERVIKRWSRLIQGLRIRQRLQEQYASGNELSISDLRHTVDEFTEAEQPGGFLKEADAVVQPFHLPRFEHNAYQPVADVGTATERDEVHDKFVSDGDVNPTTDAQLLPRSNLSAYPSEEEEDDDLEEVFPLTDSKTITSVEAQAPKSMLDFARENEARQLRAKTSDLGIEDEETLSDVRGPCEPSQNQHTNDLTTHSPARKRDSLSSIPKRRQKKNSATAKSNTSRRSARKRSEYRTSSSLSDLSDLDDNLANGAHNDEESGDVDARKSGLPSGSSRSVKRTRIEEGSTTPSSTRVLRKRIPKTVEQIRAERDAEAAYREAIAD
ncbi:hypothetical protein ACEPAH_8747 [Sanghuangporus vaninii]